MNVLSYNDDSYAGNFMISYKLIAGETYYYSASYLNPSMTGYITLYLEELLSITADTASYSTEILEGGRDRYIEFVPDESTVYTLNSIDSPNSFVELYVDTIFNSLAIGENYYYGSNFTLTYAFEAGKTYYYRVGFSESNQTGPITFHLEKAASIPVLNSPFTAEITSEVPNRLFRFVPDKTGVYTLNASFSTYSYAFLYDSGMNQLGSAFYNDFTHAFSLTHTLTAGETYYYKVGYDNGYITEEMALELNTAIPVSLSDGTFTAEVAGSGHVHYFEFTPDTTDLYILRSQQSPYTYAELYDSDMHSLHYAGSNIDRGFHFIYELVAGETYYLKVGLDEMGSGGSVTVVIEDIPKILSLGTPIETDFSAVGSPLYYELTPDTTDLYVIDAFCSNDMTCQLYDSNMNPLAYGDSYWGGTGVSSSLQYTLTAGETYYICVDSHHMDVSGTVYLNIDTIHDIPALNTPFTVEITSQAPNRLFKFVPDETGVYTLNAYDSFFSHGYLYDSHMNWLGDAFYDDFTRSFALAYTLTAGETYYYKVGCDGYSSGNITLQLNTTIPVSLSDGIITAEITERGQVRYFEFTPDTTDLYTLRAQQSPYACAELYDSHMSSLYRASSNAGRGFNFNYELVAGETYYLKVGLEETSPDGFVTVVIEDIPEILSLGTSVEIDASVIGSLQYYEFTPDATDLYVIDLFSTLDVTCQLYDSNMNHLIYGDRYWSGDGVSSCIKYTLTAGETFYIGIESHNMDASGMVYLCVDTIHDIPAIDTPFPVDISHRNYYYRFVPEKTGLYAMSSDGDSLISSQLYDSDWSFLKSEEIHGEDSSFSYRFIAGETYYFNIYLESLADEAIHIVLSSFSNSVNTIPVLNEPFNVEFTEGGEKKYFAFSPTFSTDIVFTSLNSEDTFVTIYDSNMEQLAYDDDGGEDNNFYISYPVTAGETYFFEVRYYNSATTGTMTLQFTVPCEHTYEVNTVIPPTCTSQGYTLYVCTECGASAKEDFTSKLPHHYVDGFCDTCGRSEIAPECDIAFVVDITGSMDDEIRNVANSIISFSEQLANVEIDARLSLITYSDVTTSEFTEVHMNGKSAWWTDASAFQDAISSIILGNGGDYEESLIDGLETARRLDWRAGAYKFIIVVTDATFKNNNLFDITDMSEMIQLLQDDGIVTSVTTKTSIYETYRPLVESTQGILMDIDRDFSDEMMSLLDMIYDTVEITGITVKNYPYKTTYYEGEYLDSTGLVITVHYSDGTSEDISSGFSCYPNTELTLGDTIIRIVYRGFHETIPLTVTEKIINVTDLTLDVTELSLKAGEDFILHATLTPADATNKNITWYSSNTKVATVSDGVVTAVGAGEAVIRVISVDGSFTATCTVVVTSSDTDAHVHSFSAWSYYNENQHRRVCSCGCEEYQNHIWDEGVITTPPTATTPGIITYTCTVCHPVKQETIPPTGVPTEMPAVTGGPIEALVGEEIDVPITIQNNSGISYISIQVQYDDDIFSYIAVNNGDVISSMTPSDKKNPLTLVWVNAENSTVNGTLATVKLNISETAALGYHNIRITVIECNDASEQDVVVYSESIVVHVSDFVYGDVNGDGVINGKDATRLANYLANYDYETGTSTVEVFAGADANGDGVINGKDATRLANYLANYDYETDTSTVILGK